MRSTRLCGPHIVYDVKKKLAVVAWLGRGLPILMCPPCHSLAQPKNRKSGKVSKNPELKRDSSLRYATFRMTRCAEKGWRLLSDCLVDLTENDCEILRFLFGCIPLFGDMPLQCTCLFMFFSAMQYKLTTLYDTTLWKINEKRKKVLHFFHTCGIIHICGKTL